jgi:hypothetical protein
VRLPRHAAGAHLTFPPHAPLAQLDRASGYDRKAQDDPALSEFTELVSELVSDFVPHPEFPTFRIPARPTPLDPICDHVGLDVGNDPQSISRNLFMLEWDSLPGCSCFWHLYALRLASGERVYWVDDLQGRKIIAVGPGV